MRYILVAGTLLTTLLFSACSTVYYNTMEKVGYHKRDILVDRVEGTRDAQQDAQEQFESALAQFDSVVNIENTELKKAYETLNDEYEESVEAAEEVSERIDEVEDVAEALFEEWNEEIEQYTRSDLKRASQAQLEDTKDRYEDMLASMHKAEKSMQPVLATFLDNVLFLKHNLNAQAIGSLKSEFGSLKNDINVLIKRMKASIAKSDEFINDMREQNPS